MQHRNKARFHWVFRIPEPQHRFRCCTLKSRWNPHKQRVVAVLHFEGRSMRARRSLRPADSDGRRLGIARPGSPLGFCLRRGCIPGRLRTASAAGPAVEQSMVFHMTIRPTGMFRSLPAQWQARQRKAGPRPATRKPAGCQRGAACRWSHPSLALRSKALPTPALLPEATPRQRRPRWRAVAPRRPAGGRSVSRADRGEHRAAALQSTRTTPLSTRANSQLRIQCCFAGTAGRPHLARHA